MRQNQTKPIPALKIRLILSALILLSVVQPARAQQTHHHPHHGHDGGDYSGMGGMGDGDVHHHAIRAAEFDANLPKEPAAALQYLFEKMNSAEVENDKYTSMRFQLDVVDDAKLRDVIAIEPKLDAKGSLTLSVQLAKSFEHNSLAMFEVLARLNAMMSSDGVDLNVFKEVTGSYHTPKKLLYHPVTGVYLGIHHEAGVHTIHYKVHHVSSVLNHLGIQAYTNEAIRNPLLWTEVKINEVNGSQLAARELAEFELATSRRMTNDLMKFRFVSDSEQNGTLAAEIVQLAGARGVQIPAGTTTSEAWTLYSENRLEKMKADLDRKTKLAAAELKDMKKRAADPAVKAHRDELERQPEKLEALVKKNDREGVARLLEAFLPWAEFSPFEGAMWSDWIKAIRKPNRNESILLFRGIDERDAVQVAKDANGKEVGYGFFSTILTKNQGNYTRRLRSIQTMRTKFANGSSTVKTPLQMTPKIGDIMINHSSDPVGSPFMSFTTKADIAMAWGSQGGVIVANIDKRRVLPNVNSSIKGELEMLVPLIVFPDEVLTFARAGGIRVPPDRTKMIADASAALGRTVPEETIVDTHEIFQSAYKAYAKAQRFLSSSRSCRVTFPQVKK